MQVSSVGTASEATANRFAAMSTNDFLKVLFAELQHQDPFEPQDTGAILEQLGSLRNIESQLELQQSLKSLVAGNQLAAAGNMLGKLVEGLNTNGDRVSGLVTAVRMIDQKVHLELDSGQTLEVTQVTSIMPAPSATTPADLAAAAAAASTATPQPSIIPGLVPHPFVIPEGILSAGPAVMPG